MTKYFCDRCERELLSGTNVNKIDTRHLICEGDIVVHPNEKNDKHMILCDRCEYLLNKFLENKLDINYGPSFLYY